MNWKIVALAIIISGAAVVGGYYIWTTIIPTKTVYQWEFAKWEESEWFQCFGLKSGQHCLKALWLVKRVNGEIDQFVAGQKCCWTCEGGRSWCLEMRNVWPGKVVKIVDWKGKVVRFDHDYCGRLSTDDFYGDNIKAFELYLEWLVMTYGSDVGLEPGDVKLRISHSEPPTRPHPERPGESLEVHGQTSCLEWPTSTAMDAEYVITVYEKAHETRGDVYNTIAHEFKHVLQDKEHTLDCREIASNPDFEDEATHWAETVAPPC